MTRCVTSFGPEQYEQYGKRFLETYVKWVGKPIDVYHEAAEPDFKHDLVSYYDLTKTEGCADFCLRTMDFPVMHGHAWGEEQRNYRFDVNKFCRKSFAQIDAASRKPGWLYWIDADVEFSGKFHLPKRDAFMLYLDRPEWHSCASFVGWDLTHPASAEFWKRYWLLYVTGTVFALPEWHDSFILDWLREQMKFPAHNLASVVPDEELKGPANVFDKVFKNAHHKKGNLKNADNP